MDSGKGEQKPKSDVRRDFLGRKIVLTVSRGSRPHDSEKNRPQKTVPPEKCYFCAGNEHLTPPEIARIERDGKWEIRCFPNKFPAFSPEGKKTYGRHEIIIETPDHQKTLSELSESNLFDYLSMVKSRMLSAQADSRLAYSCVFKNEGHLGGASLEHSHTQLVAMPFIPASIARLGKKEGAFEKFVSSHKKTTFAKNGDFLAFCPKSSRFHFEIWVAPMAPSNSLAELDDGKLRSLASMMKSVLSALDSITGYGPYNLVYHSAPHNQKGFPFHIQILPRLSTWAGFELATDVIMVSVVPEECARLLSEKIKGQGEK